MKKILVPTDFSACAENAVNFAVHSAKTFPSDILLVHAFELNGDVYTDYLGVNKEFNQTQLHEATEKLTELKKSIASKEHLPVESIVFNGGIKESILTLEKERNIDLVIMGTSGFGGLLKKIWGSRTAAVIGKTTVPVIAVPPRYEWKKPEKILFSTNHFETNTDILDIIFEMAACYQATVDIVVFTNQETDAAFTYMEHDRNIPAYERWLEDKYPNASCVIYHLFGSHFEDTMEKFIHQNEIDLMAMVTYRRSFADRIFHPSITKRMSYHTSIPLLAIPAKVEI